ncbi:MAG: chemotaxis protein CheC [Sulfuricella denitrificans]|nr:chemotaxis protein CheC [Sulfuricella denitrificans]
MKLSALELDALIEVANIGMNRAATQLSALLNDAIAVTVPKVHIIPLNDVASALGYAKDEAAVCVWQGLGGQIAGTAMLMFPSQESRSLVNALVGSVPSLAGIDMRTFEHEAMTEIGNIIISSAVAVISDLLRGAIMLSTPNYVEDNLQNLINERVGNEERHDMNVIVMFATLRAAQRDVHGTLILLLGVDSVSKLIARINAVLLGKLDD